METRNPRVLRASDVVEEEGKGATIRIQLSDSCWLEREWKFLSWFKGKTIKTKIEIAKGMINSQPLTVAWYDLPWFPLIGLMIC